MHLLHEINISCSLYFIYLSCFRATKFNLLSHDWADLSKILQATNQCAASGRRASGSDQAIYSIQNIPGFGHAFFVLIPVNFICNAQRYGLILIERITAGYQCVALLHYSWAMRKCFGAWQPFIILLATTSWVGTCVRNKTLKQNYTTSPEPVTLTHTQQQLQKFGLNFLQNNNEMATAVQSKSKVS